MKPKQGFADGKVFLNGSSELTAGIQRCRGRGTSLRFTVVGCVNIQCYDDDGCGSDEDGEDAGDDDSDDDDDIRGFGADSHGRGDDYLYGKCGCEILKDPAS